MVHEAPPTQICSGRPPTHGGPPLGTTFSREPDDRDDMLVYIKDNVQRLIRSAEDAHPSQRSTYMKLLDQRRDWIKGEMNVECMLSDAPAAPLGIPENVYDLTTLRIEPIDDRRRTYQRMIEMIDRTMSQLWEQMLCADGDLES